METQTIRLEIGTWWEENGRIQSTTRPVEFVGKLLAEHTQYMGLERGITECLYRTEDGRYVVYLRDWSRWQGEPNTYTLRAVDEGDLGVGGCFEMLGRAAGFGRPLTLDEALNVA